MKKLIAIGGNPATGKTTLMKKFMEGLNWERVEPRKLVVAMYNKEHDIYIIGDYSDPEEKFPGLDRLSMAVQPEAIKFIKETNSNVLFEGDRLFNSSFLESALEIMDEVKIVILNTDKQLLTERHTQRQDTQSEKFLKSRETKYDNIRTNFFLMDHIMELNNDDEKDKIATVNWLRLELLTDDVIELIN